MRKFLVVLLILSVMGGVFAQQNNWGAISGEAALSTTMDFAHKEVKYATVEGGWDGHIAVQWEKTWDNAALGAWTITLPLRASQGYFGTNYSDDPRMMKDTKANVKYVLNDLTVTLPFWFATQGTKAYTPEAKDGLIVNSGSGSGGQGILGLPVMEGNLDVNANWGNEDKKSENYTPWGFKIGVADLYTTPTMSHVGGYYHFMNGRSQLYVSRDSYSYNNTDSGDFNAYATEWWRASDYVLNPSFKNHDAKGARFEGLDGKVNPRTKYADWFAHYDYKQYQFHWENINENGIAYRFFLIPDTLNIGLAFVSSGKGYKPNDGADPDNFNDYGSTLGNPWIHSGSNTFPFFEADPTLALTPAANPGGKSDVNLIDDFLRHPVLGVKYDNEKLGVSAMVGLEPWENAAGNTDVYIHAGAYFQVLEQLKINGDISAMFATGEDDLTYGNLGTDPARPGRFGPKDIDPNFNFGIEAHYTGSIVWGSLGFKMFDLINKDYAMFGTDLMVGFGGAVNDGVYNYKGLGDSKAGPVIALKGHVNGILPRLQSLKDSGFNKGVFNIGLDLMAGWKDFVLIQAPSEQKAPELKLSVGASLGLDFWFGPTNDLVKTAGYENHMQTSFEVFPSIAWQVWNNGKITFEYNLGSTDITRAKDHSGLGTTLDINKFKTAFKWEL